MPLSPASLLGRVSSQAPLEWALPLPLQQGRRPCLRRVGSCLKRVPPLGASLFQYPSGGRESVPHAGGLLPGARVRTLPLFREAARIALPRFPALPRNWRFAFRKGPARDFSAQRGRRFLAGISECHVAGTWISPCAHWRAVHGSNSRSAGRGVVPCCQSGLHGRGLISPAGVFFCLFLPFRSGWVPLRLIFS